MNWYYFSNDRSDPEKDCWVIVLLKTKQIQINPLLKHKALKVEKNIQIPFSEKELVDALSQKTITVGFEEVRDRLIVELFYTTGIRRAELINLKLSNVNFINNTIKECKPSI